MAQQLGCSTANALQLAAAQTVKDFGLDLVGDGFTAAQKVRSLRCRRDTQDAPVLGGFASVDRSFPLQCTAIISFIACDVTPARRDSSADHRIWRRHHPDGPQPSSGLYRHCRIRHPDR